MTIKIPIPIGIKTKFLKKRTILCTKYLLNKIIIFVVFR